MSLPPNSATSLDRFYSGVWADLDGDSGKIISDFLDPTVYETHLHRHPGGLTISTLYRDGHRENYNLIEKIF